MDSPSPQITVDAVFETHREEQADDVLVHLKKALADGGFEDLDRHRVYGWAEEISAGIRPQA